MTSSRWTALAILSAASRCIPGILRDESASARKRSPWASLLRRGTNAQPADRPGLVYPILIADGRIVGTGRTLLELV